MDEFKELWFGPLILSPILIVEILLCTVCCGRSIGIRLHLTFVITSLILFYALKSKGENAAVIPIFPGERFIVHKILKPQALVPMTALVKVKAVGLNPVDYKLTHRLGFIPFLRFLLPSTGSMDMAGVVEQTAPYCPWQVGDEIFGVTFGAMQEYAIVPCFPHTRLIPPKVTFAQAAGGNIPFLTALTFLRDFKKGESILIIGASGGCGQAGILVAKALGASKIHCIASGKNEKIVRQLGCDSFYDYRDENFEKKLLVDLKGNVDMVYDGVTGDSHDYFEVANATLKYNGRYGALVGAPLDHVKDFAGKLIGQKLVRFKLQMAMAEDSDMKFFFDHEEIFSKLLIAKTLKGFDAKEIQKAFEDLKTQRVAGKIVLEIGKQTRNPKI